MVSSSSLASSVEDLPFEFVNTFFNFIFDRAETTLDRLAAIPQMTSYRMVFHIFTRALQRLRQCEMYQMYHVEQSSRDVVTKQILVGRDVYFWFGRTRTWECRMYSRNLTVYVAAGCKNPLRAAIYKHFHLGIVRKTMAWDAPAASGALWGSCLIMQRRRHFMMDFRRMK